MRPDVGNDESPIAEHRVTGEPDGAWVMQLARNLTDPSDGFLRGVQYVILDRDPLL